LKAMLLERAGKPLSLKEISEPSPSADELLIQIIACGVCRTDLHVLDGELPNPKLPLVLGHEIIGKVLRCGENASGFKAGAIVGVPWLARTCGYCSYCKRDQENLCENAIFTGYTKDGGYAELTVANKDFCFAIPENYDPISSAPLLCAGLIGWRSYKMAGNGTNLGLYGFGGAAHILTQIASKQNKKIFAFTRKGDERGQAFAKSLGAGWAGASEDAPPEPLDAAIIFAPIGPLVISALKAVRKGGTVVCGGIHMSDIPTIPYDLLWGERVIRSVANLTREDGREYMETLKQIPVKTEISTYALADANQALEDLRSGKFNGAAVLKIAGGASG
jgi:alcohol dehydrogenase, propanol-preferring